MHQSSDELEPPDEPELPADPELLDELDELELLDDSDELEAVSLLDELELPPPPLLADPDELYRSEYQPPPLRMKPLPAETCRFALGLSHSGHVSRGSALIDCTASQWWPQASHTYS
jgi:hypothetical protein